MDTFSGYPRPARRLLNIRPVGGILPAEGRERRQPAGSRHIRQIGGPFLASLSSSTTRNPWRS
jgi:hypothetical protein